MKHSVSPELSGNSQQADLPTSIDQLLVWCRLGVQSFGGGSTTLGLIRRAVVDERRWIDPDEFTRYWALVLMVPGINLLGLTILIGRKVGGVRGVVIALAGLLLPSVAITILLTALYSKVQHYKPVAAAVSGIIPATIGVGMFTGLQIAYPVLKKCWAFGGRSLSIALLLFVVSAVVEAVAHWPVVLILLSSGVIGAVTGFAGKPADSETH